MRYYLHAPREVEEPYNQIFKSRVTLLAVVMSPHDTLLQCILLTWFLCAFRQGCTIMTHVWWWYGPTETPSGKEWHYCNTYWNVVGGPPFVTCPLFSLEVQCWQGIQYTRRQNITFKNYFLCPYLDSHNPQPNPHYYKPVGKFLF
jgi:hypothetical protein